MEMLVPQIVLIGFLTAIALVGYDMRASLRPPACPECAHCRSEERRAAEIPGGYDRPDDWLDPDHFRDRDRTRRG